MSAYLGKDGYVNIGEDKVGYIDSWSLSLGVDTAEVSELGQRAKQFEATTINASGSASGTLDTQDPAQQSLLNMFTDGGTISNVDLHLVLQPGDTTDEEFTGSAVITGIEIGASHADKVTFSFNYQISGELTYNAPAV